MKIAVIVPTTSRNREWTKWEDTYLASILLPSINTEHEITMYIGYGTEDDFFMNHQNRRNKYKNIKLKWYSFTNFEGNPCAIWTELGKKSVEDYIFVCGDDIKLDANPKWWDIFIDALQKQNNMGYAAGWSNNDSIPTQFLIHRNHIQLFDFVYPPQIRNWFCDDWMANVYPNKMRYWNKNIKHLNIGGAPRYEVIMADKLYKMLIKRHRPLIYKFKAE